MTSKLQVILEMGKKRRVVAGAMDWPGLDRWGTSEDDAIGRAGVVPSAVRRVDGVQRLRGDQEGSERS